MPIDRLSRPALTSPAAIAAALSGLPDDGSPDALWQALTQAFTVDLDAAAAILPRSSEPEPHWLRLQRG